MVSSFALLATALGLSSCALADEFRIYMGADNPYDGFAVQWGSALWGRTGNHDWSCEDLNNANKVMNGYNDVNMAGGYACDGCTEADPTKITRIEVEDTEDRPFTTMKPGVTSFVKTDNGGFDIVTFDEPGGDRLGVVGTCDLIDADAQVVTCGQPLGSRQGIHLFTCRGDLTIWS